MLGKGWQNDAAPECLARAHATIATYLVFVDCIGPHYLRRNRQCERREVECQLRSRCRAKDGTDLPRLAASEISTELGSTSCLFVRLIGRQRRQDYALRPLTAARDDSWRPAMLTSGAANATEWLRRLGSTRVMRSGLLSSVKSRRSSSPVSKPKSMNTLQAGAPPYGSHRNEKSIRAPSGSLVALDVTEP